MIYSIIGLVFDVIGVILLFMYGVPSKEMYDSFLQDHTLSDEREKQINFRSKLGLILLILGFLFQILGTILSKY
tara:strand:+ start:15648 stop:15869 length:222 start_codon:yes stop_codon:yes gene_type:complete